MTAVAAGPRTWKRRHLLDVDQLTRPELEAILDEAAELRKQRANAELDEAARRLRGHTVGLAFYEP